MISRAAHARLAALVALLPLAPVVLSGACTYAWPEGALPAADAGDGGAPLEGAADRAAPGDARGDAEDGAQLTDATPSDAPESCAALAADLAALRAAATKCPVPYTFDAQDCTDAVADECGCTRWMYRASSSDTAAYQAKIAQFKSAGCTPACGACSTLPDGDHGACLATGDAGALGVACQP